MPQVILPYLQVKEGDRMWFGHYKKNESYLLKKKCKFLQSLKPANPHLATKCATFRTANKGNLSLLRSLRIMFT